MSVGEVGERRFGVGRLALPSMRAALVSSMGMVDLRVGGVLRRDRHVASEAVDARSFLESSQILLPTRHLKRHLSDSHGQVQISQPFRLVNLGCGSGAAGDMYA